MDAFSSIFHVATGHSVDLDRMPPGKIERPLDRLEPIAAQQVVAPVIITPAVEPDLQIAAARAIDDRQVELLTQEIYGTDRMLSTEFRRKYLAEVGRTGVGLKPIITEISERAPGGITVSTILAAAQPHARKRTVNSGVAAAIFNTYAQLPSRMPCSKFRQKFITESHRTGVGLPTIIEATPKERLEGMSHSGIMSAASANPRSTKTVNVGVALAIFNTYAQLPGLRVPVDPEQENFDLKRFNGQNVLWVHRDVAQGQVAPLRAAAKITEKRFISAVQLRYPDIGDKLLINMLYPKGVDGRFSQKKVRRINVAQVLTVLEDEFGVCPAQQSVSKPGGV
jgi:hypothetical protein